MGGFFSRLKERLFGKEKSPGPNVQQKPQTEGAKVQLPVPAEKQVADVPSPPPQSAIAEKTPAPQKRDPYFIQIGLDFGTAFSKCICRDMFLDKAWVHCLPDSGNPEMPFLVPSAVSFDGTTLRRINNVHGAYEPRGLYHIKMALQKVGLKDWGDPVLRPYRAASGATAKRLGDFVSACAVYLLAGILGNIRREISARFPGTIEGDYLAVNMAVPVADANHKDVSNLFDQVLRIGWLLADELAGHPVIAYADLMSKIMAIRTRANEPDIRGACYIYPEVSANVQGFIRSRTSSHGLYIFSDTGAGTVDQSVFLFGEKAGKDHLTYLHAGIFPLGSSHLERLAAEQDGDMSLKNLETWRQKKEAGEKSRKLLAAKDKIKGHLEKGTNQTVALSKKKLYSSRQINDLRVLFGGGGHCENPYRSAVLQTFDSNLFHPDEIRRRRRRNDSFDLGMPVPKDLPLEEAQRRWMDRLTVAYGLSFEKGQLATFKLPKDVDTPSPDDIWKPTRPRPDAPTKDDV